MGHQVAPAAASRGGACARTCRTRRQRFRPLSDPAPVTMDRDPFSRLPLLADGDPASALRTAQAGAESPGPPEALNQSNPGAVQAVHAAHARAGAELLRTNTAQANAAALAPHGLSERAEAINNSGSALARAGLREAAVDGEPAGFVMGTLGVPPRAGLLHDPRWERALSEQVIYLSDTAVDFFLLRHVTRLADACTLTGRIRLTSDAPVLAALHLDAHGRTEDGAEAAAAARALREAGAGALGLCCGPGPDALPAALAALLAEGRDAGLPVAVLAGIVDSATAGPPPYPGAPALTPDAYAAWLAPLAAQGVAILGGCCGVTARHTLALARALGRKP